MHFFRSLIQNVAGKYVLDCYDSATYSKSLCPYDFPLLWEGFPVDFGAWLWGIYDHS